jgi:DNA-binding transcriptional LysR family regulator
VDLNLLKTFAAVAETRSFSDAAKKLGLPKSSVSRAIAQLEEETGVQLLHRTTRHVALSASGTALYDRILPSLKGLEAAVGELPENEEQPTGELRVTGPSDLGGFLLAEAAVRFTARYPNVTMNLHLTNRVVDLVGERYDLGIRIARGPLKDSSLIVRKLAALQGHLFASPTYLARKGTPRVPRDLDGHDWLIFRAAPKKLTLGGPEPVDINLSGRIQCDDMYFAHAAIRAGAGIGFLPLWLAEPDVAAGQLVAVLPRHGQMTGQTYLVYPASKHIPLRVTAFRDLLLDVLTGRGIPVAA